MEEIEMTLPRLQGAKTWVRLNKKQFSALLESGDPFLFVVTGDKCPRCDALREILRDWIEKNEAFVGEANYFQVYKNLRPEERERFHTPRIMFFPTLIAYDKGLPVFFKAFDHQPTYEEVEEILTLFVPGATLIKNRLTTQTAADGKASFHNLVLLKPEDSSEAHPLSAPYDPTIAEIEFSL